MKSSLFALALLLPLGAAEVQAGRAPASKASTRSIMPFGGESVPVGGSVMCPIQTNAFTVCLRLMAQSWPTETMKGTVSFEVLLEGESWEDGNWYQVGTASFSDIRNEGRVMRILKTIECPFEARDFRVRFLSSNLRPLNSRLNIEGTIIY